MSGDITAIKCMAPWIHSAKVATETWRPTETDRLNAQNQNRNPKISKEIAIGISFAVFAVVALILLLAFLWRKYMSAVKEIRNLTRAEVDEFYFGNKKSGPEQQGNIPLESLPFVANKIIPSETLITESTILGEGEFGIVHRGSFGGHVVAVKSAKPTADVEHFKAFLKELKVMAYIGEHENIIRFFGAVVERIHEKMCSAVIELSPFGNLNDYLRAHASSYSDENAEARPSHIRNENEPRLSLNQAILMSFCRQIAAAMEYLAIKAVIHGDLASRNVLVFHDNIVKITDFGLSRKLYNCKNYTKTKQSPLPWRWMAIESLLYYDFSIKSDVWGFGVTMWEIFSLGKVPFSGLNWTTEFVEELESGSRLMKPRLCAPVVYGWMMKCWSNRAEDRPTFTECKDFLSAQDGRALGNIYETSI